MAACIASTSSSSSHMALTLARQMARRRPAVAAIASQSRCLHTTSNRDFDFNFKGITERIRAFRSTEEQEKQDQQQQQQKEVEEQQTPEATKDKEPVQLSARQKKDKERSEPSLRERLSFRAKNVMFGRRQQQAQRDGKQAESQPLTRRTVGGRGGLYGTRDGTKDVAAEQEYLGPSIADPGDDLLSAPEQETIDTRTEHLIARLEKRTANRQERKRWGGPLEHKYSTAVFRISPQKLQLLADQINGKPIDHAILQMQFSQKRASQRILSTLCLARDHAIAKGLDRSRMVVSEAWVNKGTSAGTKYLNIMGRGRFGIAQHPKARMLIVLRHGKSRHEEEEKRLEKARRMVRSIGTGGVTRTARPLTASRPAWGY